MRRINPTLNYNLILFSLNFVYIFIIGLLPKNLPIRTFYYVIISFIFYFSLMTFKKKAVVEKGIYFPILLILLLWIGFIFDLPLLVKITGFASTLFFFIIVILLVYQVAKSKSIGPIEFLESVNTYLLFGIAASILFKGIYNINHESFSSSLQNVDSRSNFIYFAFVTLTTLGYGDIVPLSPAAKSITIFFSVSGQLYLTMIIALLVGKYLNSK